MPNIDPNDAIEICGYMFGSYIVGYMVGFFFLTFKKTLDQI
jgi:hypothetical protein